ncbi:MAG TPA: Gfo/Idh/MocA family oxidoreductase [Candidatus Limnocylindrales bacterium]|jgi:myo-inositol 2-dehydrogenase / D-chiro-inositol 1-dehydrogenase|nr:Gfo/Idh/MocA family oxidoreductase [Candidatus Limnocylindrales bacterium]
MPSDVAPLRVGFIGAGVFSTWAIYPALHLAPLDLRAVCDIDEAKARDAANRFGGRGRWYTDHRRMWAEEDLEAVIIWMRPGARQDLVVDALDAGYHVLIPKPPALSLEDTRALAAASDRTGRSVMVHFHRRFSLGVSKAVELMARPSFGALTQLFASFTSGAYDAVRGAGFADPVHAYLCDFAVHHLDLARWLGGEVRAASAYHDVRGAGSAVAVALQFENGAVGNLQLTSQRVWWRNYDRIELTGQGEYIVLDGLWGYRHYTADDNTFSENYSDERSTELGGDGAALTEFVTSIRAGRAPRTSIQDAVRTMCLYQAIYDAYRAGHQGPLDLPQP